MHVCQCTGDYTDSAVTLACHILRLLVSLLHSLSTKLNLKLDLLNYRLLVASFMLFRLSNSKEEVKKKTQSNKTMDYSTTVYKVGLT